MRLGISCWLLTSPYELKGRDGRPPAELQHAGGRYAAGPKADRCRQGRKAPVLEECRTACRSGILGDVDSEPELPLDRRQEIDARLDAVRARLKTLRERGVGDSQATTRSERAAAAQRYAVEAHAAAAEVLASSAEAFRHAADAHERAASLHDRTAANGIGDVRGHERQAALHRAAAAADRQRAERAQALISDHGRAGQAPVSDEPRDGVAL